MRYLAVLLFLAACGRGGVSDPGAVADPGKITIQPATATLYAGLPTTFQITGGTGSYIATSSDQAALPVSGSTGRTLIVVPNAVSTETAVTLTVRDTGATSPATAELTVKPMTIANTVTLTPTAGCEPAVCAGSDAVVTAVLMQNGPLAARAVRFEVVSGDFRFITSQPGIPESTDLTTTVTTDASGTATARLRADANIRSQTGVLRVIDAASGASKVVNFPIASDQGLFAAPDKITFTGPDSATCSSGVAAAVAVLGGVPPYSVLPSGAPFAVDTMTVPTSGGIFRVIAAGACATNSPILILDSAGHTATVNVSNIVGTIDPVLPLIVQPQSVTLARCSSVATIVFAGGTGTYVVNPSDTGLVVNTQGTSATIRPAPKNMLPAASNVVVVSGSQSQVVTVNIDPAATGC